MATLLPTPGSDGRRDGRRTLRVLLVEDVEDDAALILRALETGNYTLAWERVESAAALREALARQSWDIVLCDYVIPGFGGPAALHLLRGEAPNLPVIVVSGQAGETYAVEIMRAGARDYVRKDNLARLVPAVERELREADVRREHHLAAAESRSWAALAEVVIRIATLFVRLRPEEVDAGMIEALGAIGEHVGADRSYVFQFTPDASHLDNTHEWCAGGVEPQIERLQNLEATTFPWAITRLRRGEVVLVPRVVDLPAEARAEKESFTEQAIQSLVLVPMANGATVTGFVGYDAVGAERSWSAKDVALLRVVSQIFANALERRRSEEALRAAEARYRSLVEEIDEVIYTIDSAGVITYASPAVEVMGGYTPAEIIGHHFAEFIHPDDLPGLGESFRRTITGRLEPSEYRVLTRGRGVRWVRSFSQPIRDGDEIVGLRAALMDITDRKLAELALEENERRWRCLVENSQDLITIVNLDGDRLYASPSHRRVYGYTDAEIQSANAFTLLHPDEREELVRRFQREMSVPGNRMAATFRYRHKDGSYRIIEAAMVSMVDDPAVRGVVINSRDVTERVRAQQAAQEELERLVAERTAQLATVNRELEAFCYSISHDLRVPLRAIRGFGRELLEHRAGQLDAEGRQDLERIDAAATRMNQLIDDLLALSRVAHAELRRTRVDMTGLARAVARDLQSMDPEREVEFVIAPEVVADGDARLLRIAIENLLNNSWKYTGHHRTARIEFGVRFEADEPEYFVRDDGAGFDAANAARLFGPFQRLHGSEFEGSGIGLATVARIIHRHGGEVRAEGAVERGATVSFTLPAA